METYPTHATHCANERNIELATQQPILLICLPPIVGHCIEAAIQKSLTLCALEGGREFMPGVENIPLR